MEPRSGAAAAGISRPVGPGTHDAWDQALREAAGCLDDVGMLVWVRGLPLASAVEARALTQVRGGVGVRAGAAPDLVGLIGSAVCMGCRPPDTGGPEGPGQLNSERGSEAHAGDDSAASFAAHGGARCSYSFNRLLLQLATSSKGAAAVAASAAGRAARQAASGPQAAAAAAANVTGVLAEALLSVLDRDPDGGPMGLRQLLRAALLASSEYGALAGPDRQEGGSSGGDAGADGAGGGAGGVPASARGKRARSGAPVVGAARDGVGAGDGAAGAEDRRLLCEMLMQAVCGAAAQLDSAPMAAAVLRVGGVGWGVLGPCFAAASTASRKALLDLAAAVAKAASELLTVGEEDGGAGAGAGSGGGGANGGDATEPSAATDTAAASYAVACAVLTAAYCCTCNSASDGGGRRHHAPCSMGLPAALGSLAASPAPVAPAAAYRQAGTTLGSLATMLGGGRRRWLLDRTRTVRSKALQLLLELLSLPGHQAQAQAHVAAGRLADAPAAAAAAGRRRPDSLLGAATNSAAPPEVPEPSLPSPVATAAARQCFPEVCALLEATHGSPLYDESSGQVLQQVASALPRALEPAGFLRLLLGRGGSPEPQPQRPTGRPADGSAGIAGVHPDSGSQGSGVEFEDGTFAAARMSPRVCRMLAVGLAQNLAAWRGHGGCGAATLGRTLYDIVVAHLRPLLPDVTAPSRTASPGGGGGGGGDGGDGSGGSSEADAAAAAARRVGDAFGDTALHTELWQHAFGELCEVLGGDEEGGSAQMAGGEEGRGNDGGDGGDDAGEVEVGAAPDRQRGQHRDTDGARQAAGGPALQGPKAAAAPGPAPRLVLGPGSTGLGRLLCAFMGRALPRVLRCGGAEAVDAAYAVLSKCPGSAPLLHRELKASLLALRQQQQVTTAAPRASDLSVPATVRYLLLLSNMARLYEYERAAFLDKLLEARRRGASEPGGGGDHKDEDDGDGGHDAGDGGHDAGERGADGEGQRDADHGGRRAVAQGPPLVATASPGGGEGGEGGVGGVGGEGEDYMRQVEEDRGCRVVAQRMLEKVMGCSAPATHAPALAAMLAAVQPAAGCPGGGPPRQAVTEQALAMRALGRLLVQSERLCERHGSVVSELLGSWRRRPVGLVCEALATARELVLRNPNRHRPLVGLMESLIQAALQGPTPTAATAAVAEGSRHAGQSPAGPIPPAAGSPAAGVAAAAALAAVLSAAVGCYCSLLSTGRLQWSPATFRTVAVCLLVPGPAHEQVCAPAAALLLQHAGASTGGAAAAAGSLRRTHAALGLLRNCPAPLRSRLVSEVLLPPDTTAPASAPAGNAGGGGGGGGGGALLRPEDLASDDLALPAIQALFAAGGARDAHGNDEGACGAPSGIGAGEAAWTAEDGAVPEAGEGGGGGREGGSSSAAAAALLLLREMTPSARVLGALLPQLQAALRDPWVLETFTNSAVRTLRDYVVRYRSNPGTAAAAAAAASGAAMVAPDGAPADGGGVGQGGAAAEDPEAQQARCAAAPGTATRGGAAAVQRKLLEVLGQLSGRVGQDRNPQVRVIGAGD
ncbi:hypothetical protein GPECTOR_97g753 [Gonium pectorale]|uniref:Uncharacterized protein n=1 Tax=Gonium pectorale TaxID=33097 RepID=A0A150G174_GONPE|nr:hypothetical protein GPECTOR_97g753 [Gonium pectorale]|eukprot:KXZ43215.1 hypothetical protein GPECTOR_97g753 [Gonium pectorale]